MKRMKERNRWALILGAVVFALGLSGCATDYLVFTTYTKVGLDISFVNQAPRQVVFGFKRFEGAVIPIDKEDKDGEVASVFAAIRLSSNWLTGMKIYQDFATGDAAVQAAAGN